SKGGFTYTPDQNYVGADSFTFKASDGTLDSNTATVSVTVKAVNHPPVASNGTLTTDENQSASGTLAASDADGDALTFSIVSKPAHGTVTITDASTGAYTYTSTQGYSGSDSFTFKASDGTLDSNTATVSITVKAVTPPPPPPPPPPPSGGGGGAFGGLGLLMLLGLALVGAGLKLRRS
ncbi:MAG: tandem-95 repeat protein, partial [Gammaproteobacteria bacterium]